MNSNSNDKIISILEEFIDFLKEKDDEKKVEKEVDVIEDEEVVDDDDADDFDKTIDKISKGE